MAEVAPGSGTGAGQRQRPAVCRAPSPATNLSESLDYLAPGGLSSVGGNGVVLDSLQSPLSWARSCCALSMRSPAVVQGVPHALGIPLTLSMELCLQLVGVCPGRTKGPSIGAGKQILPGVSVPCYSLCPLDTYHKLRIYLYRLKQTSVSHLQPHPPTPTPSSHQPWSNSVQPIYAAGVGQS